MRLVVCTFSVIMMVFGGAVAYGQDYPTKPIQIFTIGAGGNSDFAARLVGRGLSDRLGQPVVIQNRGGVLPMETVAKAPADGYTLLVHGSAIWLTPFFQKNVTYDPVRDFSPISLTGTSPNILTVHPSMPVKSVRDLIDLAKASPGKLSYPITGYGGSAHLAAELFIALTGIDLKRVAYKGSAQSLADLFRGELHVSFSALTIMPHIKSGKRRALAVTSARPSPLVPELPTIAASGVPGYESVSTIGVFAPTKTPVSIINRLNREIVQVLNNADVKQKFFETGVETVGSSPEELAALVKSDIAKFAKIFKEAGLKPE